MSIPTPTHLYPFTSDLNDTKGTADLSSTGSPTITHSQTEGMALNKQGSASKYVSVPLGDIGMDSGKSWSLSWWYKIGSGVNWEDVVILGTRDHGVDYGLQLVSKYSLNANGIYCVYGFYGNDVFFYTGWPAVYTNVTNNQWVHFVIVYDKDNELGDGTHRKKMYVDGVELTNTSGVHNEWLGNNTTHKLDIGGRGWGSALNGNQYWLNLAIFDKALSLAEAQAIYAKDKYYGYGYEPTPISSISGSGVSCGTTSERDNLTYVEEGDVFYNTETSELQIYKNSVWRSLSHKIANDRNAFKITSGDSVPTLDSNSKEGNIYYNTNTGKLRIREESAWQVTSKQSITDRAEFKTLYGASTPSVNTIQNVFYNTDTKKLQYLKNDAWRTVAEEEVAGDTFNVGVDSYKFSLNNAVQPELNLYRGNEYVFNQSSADNSGQRLFVSNDLSGRVVSGGIVASDVSNLLIIHYEFESSNDIGYNSATSTIDATAGGVGGVSTIDTSSKVGTGSLKLTADPNFLSWFKINTSITLNNYTTITFWFKWDIATSYSNPFRGYEKLLYYKNGTNGSRFQITRPTHTNPAPEPTFLSFYVQSTGKTAVKKYTDNIIYNNVWYHVAWVINNVDNDAWKVYINNALITPASGSDTNTQNQLDITNTYNTNYFGRHADQESDHFDGNIDDFRIYTSSTSAGALTAAQIAELYNSSGTPSSTISENTAGVTSTGTLGTDLVSTWRVPTDASDTMYYASDGSANAGGKINITNVPAQEKTFVVDVSMVNISITLLAGAGGLTGTGGSEGTALASSVYSTSNHPATKAFNGTLADSIDCWNNAANSTAEEWLKFEFPYDVTITSYKMWDRTPSTHAYHPVAWKLHSFTSSQPFDSTNYDIDDTNTLIDTRTKSQNSDNGISMTPQITPNSNSIVNDDTFRLFNIPLANQKQGRTIVIFFPYPDSRLNRNDANWPLNIGELAYYGKNHNNAPDIPAFTLGGLAQPTLNLYRDSVYKFDQSDPDNVGQRLYVSNHLSGRNIDNIDWELSSPFTITNNWSHKLAISDQTLDWSNTFCIKIVYTPTNDMNTGGQGMFGRLFDFETQNAGSVPYFTIALGRAGSDDRWYFEAEDVNDVDMIDVKDFYHLNTTPGDYPIKDNKYNLIVEYNNGILKISNELNSSFTSWDNTLSNKLITQYTIPINSRNSITYDNCYIGNRNSNWNRPFVGTIHSFEIAETLPSLTENTTGVTSTGTLGTDLITTWRVPTDASDTMYYASDGSANMGGTISITDAPTKTTRVTTIASSAGSNGGGDTYTKYAVDVSLNRFTIGGHMQPTLNLYKDSIYKFDQSDPDNIGQRLFVSNDADGGARGVVGNKLPDVAMTSNDTTDCEASVSSQYIDSGDWSAFKAFNHVIGSEGWSSLLNVYNATTGDANTGGANSSFQGIYGQWIKIRFKTKSFLLKELKVYPRTGHYGNNNLRAPDDGYVFGSLDGTTWTELRHFTAITNSGNYQSDVGKIINVSATTAFSYYVLLTTKLSASGGGQSILNISEIEFYPWDGPPQTENTTGFTSTGTLGTNLVSTWRVPTDASDTMYYASDGSANAGGKINVEVTPYEEKTYALDVSLNRFTLGGIAQPTLNLYRDSVYKFDQSDPDNVGQRLFVSNDLSGRTLRVVGDKLPDVAMTSNDTTDCEASASSLHNDLRAFNAFNHVIGNEGWHSATNVYNVTTGYANTGVTDSSFQGIYGQWIKIRFKTKSFLLKELKVYPREPYGINNLRAPDDGYVFGSLDGTTWTELLHFTAITNSGNYQSNVGKIINVSATTAFSYYVLLTTKLSGSAGEHNLNISEIELYPWDDGLSSNTAGVTSTGTLGTDLVTRWRVPTDASDTMYYASDGSANAGGTINIFNNTNDTTTPTIECLTTSSAVNVISSGGNKYRFNGDTTYVENKYYGLGAGTFTFTGVPSGHPIAILNAGKTSLISYTGDNANKSSKTVSGTTSDGDYDFYHGDVTVTVSGDFGSVSVYCVQHGYMGGENLLRYSSSCIPIWTHEVTSIFPRSDGSWTGNYEAVSQSILADWNGWQPDKDWYIRLSVTPDSTSTHTVLFNFTYNNGFGRIIFFKNWGLVFEWSADTASTKISIGYTTSSSNITSPFDLLWSYNSANYTSGGGGTSPDHEDNTLFIKHGSNWVQVPRASTSTADHTFLYYSPQDNIDEADTISWPASMTGQFGTTGHAGTYPVSNSLQCGMTNLKLGNTVPSLSGNEIQY